MAFLVLLGAFLVVDLIAWRWGADSRDGNDWRPLPL